MKNATAVIAALENLTKVIREGCDLPATAQAAAPATPAKPKLKGNRTEAITNYNGGVIAQDLMDVARRSVRYARTGKTLSKAERKVARNVMKAFKAQNRVLNTNGRDIFGFPKAAYPGVLAVRGRVH